MKEKLYNLGNYPKLLKNYFLLGKNTGSSFILRGKITIVAVMVVPTQKPWKEMYVERFKEAVQETAKWLESEATRFDMDLKVDCQFLTCMTDKEIKPESGYKMVEEFFGEKNIDLLQRKLEKEYKSNETPILLGYDLIGRSFAFRQDKDSRYVDEISTVFRTGSRFDWKVMAHELLHQFGAADYYFPEKIRICANKYLGSSIMDCHNNAVVDDLTAYLVGWKSVVSKNTYKFIKKTMWMSTEEYVKQFDKDYNLNSKIIGKNSKI